MVGVNNKIGTNRSVVLHSLNSLLSSTPFRGPNFSLGCVAIGSTSSSAASSAIIPISSSSLLLVDLEVGFPLLLLFAYFALLSLCAVWLVAEDLQTLHVFIPQLRSIAALDKTAYDPPIFGRGLGMVYHSLCYLDRDYSCGCSDGELIVAWDLGYLYQLESCLGKLVPDNPLPSFYVHQLVKEFGHVVGL